MPTEPQSPTECACRALYAQNYPQFLWIPGRKPYYMPVSLHKTQYFAVSELPPACELTAAGRLLDQRHFRITA